MRGADKRGELLGDKGARGGTMFLSPGETCGRGRGGALPGAVAMRGGT